MERRAAFAAEDAPSNRAGRGRSGGRRSGTWADTLDAPASQRVQTRSTDASSGPLVPPSLRAPCFDTYLDGDATIPAFSTEQAKQFMTELLAIWTQTDPRSRR